MDMEDDLNLTPPTSPDIILPVSPEILPLPKSPNPRLFPLPISPVLLPTTELVSEGEISPTRTEVSNSSTTTVKPSDDIRARRIKYYEKKVFFNPPSDGLLK
jgi:hypothetical protein